MKDKLTPLAILAVVMLILGVSFLWSDNNRLKEEIAHEKATIQYLTGMTLYQGETVVYNLVSIDGGKHWATYEHSGDGLKIIGPADENLVKMVIAQNKLFDYVTSNGPVKSTDAEGMKLMRDAGVTTIP